MNSWTSPDDDDLQELLFCSPDCDFDSELFQTHPRLSKFTPEILRWRTILSSQFTAVFSQLLSDASMSSFVLQARAAIPLRVKSDPLFARPANAAMPTVPLDRDEARRYYETGQGRSLLQQVIALESEGEFVLSTLRAGEHSPWTVHLLNEHAIDQGGPGRECFADVASELFLEQLGLFSLTPNSQKDSKDKQDSKALKLVVPKAAPLEGDSIRHSMYRFAGAWLAVAITSQLPQPFPFAAIVWKALTRTPLTIDDIYQMDLDFKEWMRDMAEMGSSCFDNAFKVANSAGIMSDLLLNGKSIRITPRDHQEYMEMCQTFRIHEFDSQLEAMRMGFNTIVKEESARLLTPANLNRLSCGLAEFPISRLRQQIVVTVTNAQIEMFWEMMEQFTTQERSQCIKFGSAKINLPPAGVPSTERFKVNFVGALRSEELPTAITCHCIVSIPPYSTLDVMAGKFRLAFAFGSPIED
jgi:hypothetical protein